MARGHGWSHFKDQLLASTLQTQRSPINGQKVATTSGTPLFTWKFLKISSGQRVDSIQQVFLACDSSDLIAQLAVLEKE